MRKACAGEYRLLYLSPERLARNDTIEWLQRFPISFFAIDEAHCISEWGHEFRPEYRQLSSLRAHFPDRPIAAFTASATRRVRHDILHQLQLRDPHKYIASFHRPNLRYLVKECAARRRSRACLSRALRNYAGQQRHRLRSDHRQSGETVDFLEDEGIPAIAYHGKMEADERRNNQERWMADEVRVLVGTIAFGLGINKACRAGGDSSLATQVHRAVLSGSGRAGRDGDSGRLPPALAEAGRRVCWRYFIDQIVDPAEKRTGLAALSRNPALRRFSRLPASPDLFALWRKSEMGDLRRVRHVRL